MAVTGLHVLIDPERVPSGRLPAFLSAIIRGGATVVQVRIKSGSTREALRYIETVIALARPPLQVMINDRLDWALAAGADGVHLGQDDMPGDRARALAPGLVVGASAGNLEELEKACAQRPDYIGVGPVFETPSKADAGSPLGIAGLRNLVQKTPAGIVVVAIGGIGAENAGPVWKAGVGGLAVIHAVAGAADPEGACRALIRRP